jgi:hypothetical protein
MAKLRPLMGNKEIRMLNQAANERMAAAQAAGKTLTYVEASRAEVLAYPEKYGYGETKKSYAQQGFIELTLGQRQWVSLQMQMSMNDIGKLYPNWPRQQIISFISSGGYGEWARFLQSVQNGNAVSNDEYRSLKDKGMPDG